MMLENEDPTEFVKFMGLEIAIEFPAGSTKHGKNSGGKSWKRHYKTDYGYIKNAIGVDGDNLDCFLATDPDDSCDVYVVHQLSIDGEEFDEDKCMLGYSSEEEAVSDFKEHCHKPEVMFGGCSAMSQREFKKMLKKCDGTKIMGNKKEIENLNESVYQAVTDAQFQHQARQAANALGMKWTNVSYMASTLESRVGVIYQISYNGVQVYCYTRVDAGNTFRFEADATVEQLQGIITEYVPAASGLLEVYSLFARALKDYGFKAENGSLFDGKTDVSFVFRISDQPGCFPAIKIWHKTSNWRQPRPEPTLHEINELSDLIDQLAGRKISQSLADAIRGIKIPPTPPAIKPNDGSEISIMSEGRVVKKFASWSKFDEWKRFVGPSIADLYEVSHVIKGKKILKEGLAAGDLEDILVPRVSIDEYVAKDGGDNIVIAFFVANIPEAVEPLRRFCDRCPGVIETDSGDADTMKNTSIVYVEMDRDKIDPAKVSRLIELVFGIANLKLKDVSLCFPNTTDMFPYSADAVLAYFSKLIVAREKAKRQELKAQQ